MRVDLFDFDLPEENIALRPAEPRDSARLLLVRAGESGFEDASVSGLGDCLRPGDALVFNDTKVIPAQLEGFRERDGAKAQIGATLHMRVGSDRWKAFLRPAKRIRAGERIDFGHGNNACLIGSLQATVAERGEAGEALLVFDFSGADLDQAIA
ncbi:MAG: S-adenosylmethionine:tRNA ribosyltransferase-isomerase, partial [Alphaproteobacteria bacterium]